MKDVDAPGRLVGSGRYADVYDIGRGRVLRRYRDASARAGREAEVMTHARAHGVPVPEVFAYPAPTWSWNMPAVPPCSSRSPVGHGRGGITPGSWLTCTPWCMPCPSSAGCGRPFGAGPALLHLDLHPDNVILAAAGPCLIDWQGAAQGPAEADLALTWVLVATGQVPGPPAQRAVGRAGQALFARSYRAAAGAVSPAWLASAARHRLEDPSVHAAEAVRIRRLLRSARLTDRPRR